MNELEKVRLFIEVFHPHPDAEPDDIVRALCERGLSEEDAECLLVFVPMAFAHAVLTRGGARLPAHFIIVDPHTRASKRGALADEPLFQTALAMATPMTVGNDAGKRLAARLTAGTAHWATVQQLTAGGGRISDCVLIEATLWRVPLSHLPGAAVPAPPRGGWWARLWRRLGRAAMATRAHPPN